MLHGRGGGRELLSCDEPLPWPVRLSIAHDIASALAYTPPPVVLLAGACAISLTFFPCLGARFIHSNGIIHRVCFPPKAVSMYGDADALRGVNIL
jgi:hypothetical protein